MLWVLILFLSIITSEYFEMKHKAVNWRAAWLCQSHPLVWRCNTAASIYCIDCAKNALKEGKRKCRNWKEVEITVAFLEKHVPIHHLESILVYVVQKIRLTTQSSSCDHVTDEFKNLGNLHTKVIDKLSDINVTSVFVYDAYAKRCSTFTWYK